jgi:hypothetical protein
MVGVVVLLFVVPVLLLIGRVAILRANSRATEIERSIHLVLEPS